MSQKHQHFQFVFLFLWVISRAIPLSAEDATGRRVAFLVGVNKYEKSGFSELNYAESDVTALQKLLKDRGFEKTVILKGSTKGEYRATKRNIEHQLQRFLSTVNKQDIVIIALSGHGVQKKIVEEGEEKEVSFYCPIDAVEGDVETLFSINELTDKMLAGRSQHNLVLIDACRNVPKDKSRGKGNEQGIQSKGVEGRQIQLAAGIGVLFSCSAGQESYENEDLEHGVFTHCVLDALNGEWSDDGEITCTGVVHRVEKLMTKEMQKYIPEGKQQVPVFAGQIPPTLLAKIKTNEVPNPRKPADRIEKRARKPVEGEMELAVPEPVPNRRKRNPQLNRPWNDSEDEETGKEQFRDYEVLSESQIKWAEKMKIDPSPKNSIGMKFVVIPPGSYFRGSESPISAADQKPIQEVTISKGFYLGRVEVTQDEWEAVARTSPWKNTSDSVNPDLVRVGGDFPAVNLDWGEASAFCRELTDHEKINYRLPTEAEWEYACRAETTGDYSFGDDDTEFDKFGWFLKNSKGGDERIHEVGTKLPNGFGLYDMHGNVGEWCMDGYSLKAYKPQPVKDPKGRGEGYKVVRGGAVDTQAQQCSSAARWKFSPNKRFVTLGFRVVREIPNQKTTSEIAN